MTHDELLFKIYEIHNNSSDAGQEATKQYKGMIQFMQALRAVVNLHKPSGEGLGYAAYCHQCMFNHGSGEINNHAYPCPTIQAIEEELK